MKRILLFLTFAITAIASAQTVGIDWRNIKQNGTFAADVKTAAGTSTFTAFGNSLGNASNAATAQSLLGLTPGTNVQAYSANLQALGANPPSYYLSFPNLTNKPATLAAAGITSLTPFPIISYSGLNVTIGAFKVGDFTYTGGTIAAVASKTQFVVVNLKTGLLHCLQRVIGDGEIAVAKVVTSGSAVTSIDSIPIKLPRTRIPRSLSKFQRLIPLTVGCYGSSLVENGASTDGWQKQLFDPTYAMNGYGAGIAIPNYITNGSLETGDLSGWTATGSSPTNITFVGGVGPNGENAMQWGPNAGGRLWQQSGSAGGAASYTFSIMARVVSGSASATVRISDFATDTVRATGTTVTLDNTWKLVTVTGTTTTAGYRAEILCSAGAGIAVQITKVMCYTTISVATNTNYGVGGTTARYSIGNFGVSIRTFGTDYGDTQGVYEGLIPAQFSIPPASNSMVFRARNTMRSHRAKLSVSCIPSFLLSILSMHAIRLLLRISRLTAGDMRLAALTLFRH